MLSLNSNVRKVVPVLAALLCILGLALSVPAAADVSVYQGLVPLKSNTEADRNAAFGDALRSAAVRASGQRDAGSNPVIAAAAADPTRYVQQYSTTADHYLKVGFDARAMDQLLQQAGLPLWPLERPVTQVLVVVPSVAGGARAIVDGDRAPERTEIERAAQARGLPIAFPQSSIDAARVRAIVANSDTAQSAGASRPLLAGIGSGGPLSWRFTQPAQSASGEGSLQDGVNLAADSLAARYAPPSTRGTNSVTIRVGGVTDIRIYAGVMEYLKSLSLVRAMALEEMDGGVATLKLAVRGDLELLRRVAALDGHLQPATPGPEEGAAAVDFTYQP